MHSTGTVSSSCGPHKHTVSVRSDLADLHVADAILRHTQSRASQGARVGILAAVLRKVQHAADPFALQEGEVHLTANSSC